MSKPQPPLTIISPGTTAPPPPRKLAPPGLALWTRVQREYLITDSGGVEILCLACQALDRAESLSAAIAEEGQTIRTRSGIRAHPALRDEIANRALVARLLSKLGINVEPTKASGGPYRRTAGRRRHDDQPRSDRPPLFGADHARGAGGFQPTRRARKRVRRPAGLRAIQAMCACDQWWVSSESSMTNAPGSLGNSRSSTRTRASGLPTREAIARWNYSKKLPASEPRRGRRKRARRRAEASEPAT